MEKYNPSDYLLKIQKIKYNEAFIPILLVISGFAVNFIYPLNFVKYLSLLGLVLYILISVKYHVKRNIPPDEVDIVLSPVYGKVIRIDHDPLKLTIQKNIFSPADYRCGSPNENLVFKVISGKSTSFEENSKMPGKLIGILPLSGLIECQLTDEYEIVVNKGQKVISGETIIARKKV